MHRIAKETMTIFQPDGTIEHLFHFLQRLTRILRDFLSHLEVVRIPDHRGKGAFIHASLSPVEHLRRNVNLCIFRQRILLQPVFRDLHRLAFRAPTAERRRHLAVLVVDANHVFMEEVRHIALDVVQVRLALTEFYRIGAVRRLRRLQNLNRRVLLHPLKCCLRDARHRPLIIGVLAVRHRILAVGVLLLAQDSDELVLFQGV